MGGTVITRKTPSGKVLRLVSVVPVSEVLGSAKLCNNWIQIWEAPNGEPLRHGLKLVCDQNEYHSGYCKDVTGVFFAKQYTVRGGETGVVTSWGGLTVQDVLKIEQELSAGRF